LVESKRKDASLEEFMEVMQPKTKVASWVDYIDPLLSPPEKVNASTTLGGLEDTPEEAQQDLTDMEWMRQRMKGGAEDADSLESVFKQSDGGEENDPTEETILRTARLFVRNLTFACTEEELRPLFLPFGAVSQVRGIYFLRWIESTGWWGEM
jgi:multiple RNA-binding domain-containing protein 1